MLTPVRLNRLNLVACRKQDIVKIRCIDNREGQPNSSFRDGSKEVHTVQDAGA